MTNKHIELVKKYLEDPESVSREGLRANAKAAAAAARAADAADAARAADGAADWAAGAAWDAAYWVKKYEELNK